ncbi:uncharacterized protein DNG_04370 [Cephalotrichum gorgonifer]|uniref:Rhodopsin domain-containing protein n=1 Tax=Cephalotrichum gorgonifer TaxID=2041049 RepID=A0AAE8SV40_9PEZI|nr:uncharacterized protein DNG_04370 [Cephalotrichum gorgonifer]
MSYLARISPRQDAQTPGVVTVMTIVDHGPRFITTTWSLTALAAFFLGLRIFSKAWRKKQIWWDDYVLIASWITLATSCSLISYGVALGWGKNNFNIPPENFEKVLFFSYAAGFASILAAMWSKVSFAITLLRISKGRIIWVPWVIIVTVILVLGANATIHWIQCWPVSRLWDGNTVGRCWPRQVVINYNIFAACYSGVADIALALIPWMIIWPSAISKKEKLGALTAMSMGIFAGITSFLKITTVTAIDSNDTTWSS